MTVATDETEGAESTFNAGTICMFPGNLTLPRQETYKGEETFGGDIGYGMFNEIDYHKLEGHNVVIVGHGAFAVENIRTYPYTCENVKAMYTEHMISSQEPPLPCDAEDLAKAIDDDMP